MDVRYASWCCVAAIASAMPISFMKIYTETKIIFWVFLSIFSYCVLVLAYSIILINKNITIIYPLLKMSSFVIVAAVGYICFNNKLNAQSLVGLLLGIVSICLLSNQS